MLSFESFVASSIQLQCVSMCKHFTESNLYTHEPTGRDKYTHMRVLEKMDRHTLLQMCIRISTTMVFAHKVVGRETCSRVRPMDLIIIDNTLLCTAPTSVNPNQQVNTPPCINCVSLCLACGFLICTCVVMRVVTCRFWPPPDPGCRCRPP